jgi:hypothetical protein
MATQPRSAAEHYAAAERLVDAAESSVTEQMQASAALIALVHAVLSTAPRKARKRPAKHSNGGNGLPANITWGDE